MYVTLKRHYSTYHTQNAASRLDRFYIDKGLLPDLRSDDVCPVEFSNHCGYIISIRMPKIGIPFGRGLWKINNSVLEDAELSEQK